MSGVDRGDPGDGPARPSRVLVLLDSLEGMGGAETLAVDLVIGLDPSIERTLCIARDQGHLIGRPEHKAVLARLREGNVQILELGRRSGRSLLPWVKLIRFLRDERIEVLHAHKFGSNAWGVLCGRLARVPAIVAHEHMWSYEDSGALRRFIDRAWIGRGSDAFVAVSEEGRRQLIETEGVRPGDVVYIPNGVPAPPPHDREDSRRRLEAAEDEVLVGTVALLRPEKQLQLLVEAAGILRPRWPQLRTRIVGEGPERERLELAISSSGLEDVVTLLGYRDDVAELLPGLDIAICCSRFEGGPLSVMEYMEASLPVVATRVGGLPELLDHGAAGLLVDPDGAKPLAAGIEELLADPARRAALGSSGFDRKRKVYSLDVWVRRMEELYRHLLDGGRGAVAQPPDPAASSLQARS